MVEGNLYHQIAGTLQPAGVTPAAAPGHTGLGSLFRFDFISTLIPSLPWVLLIFVKIPLSQTFYICWLTSLSSLISLLGKMCEIEKSE